MTEHDHRIELIEPDQWNAERAAITQMRVWLDDSRPTSVHFTANDLQTIVNAAALQYGIRPECTCPADDWDPNCPTDGSGRGSYCTTTKRDGYGEPWGCFLRLNHKGYCAFQRTTSLPEDHPERGRA